MSRIRILVCRVEDEIPDAMTELAHFDLPQVDVTTLRAETALDDLEASTLDVGQAALRRVLEARWEEIDKKLAQEYRQSFPPREPQGWTGTHPFRLPVAWAGFLYRGRCSTIGRRQGTSFQAMPFFRPTKV